MIDLDDVRALRVQDGDLLVVPHNTETECMHDLIEALRHVLPDAQVRQAGAADQHVRRIWMIQWRQNSQLAQ